jgi:hypothetical protein
MLSMHECVSIQQCKKYPIKTHRHEINQDRKINQAVCRKEKATHPALLIYNLLISFQLK